ncbi:hypothetical protein [Plantibacter sp. CFBP 8775]|uniref:hypothetical protein n=1 Tax=Plantibacter sp. CFBP 8775 TaxID=2774038 RepID=UPI00177D9127|nr:hypothetical protein [Plantibacter sp. CFBP 8775]MBD8104794.1 hypothetical protein [Plantibacter sp. CFBP 8775]
MLRGSLDALLYPSTTPSQLEQLLELLYALAPEESAVAATPAPGPLPRGGRRELTAAGRAFMDAPGGGADASRNGYQALLAAANAGWDYQDVVDAARTAPGLEHFRTQNTGQGRRRRRRPAEAENRLQRAWTNAMARAALNQYAPVSARPQSRDEAGWAEFEASLVDVSRILESFRVNPGRWGGRHGDPANRSVLTALAFLVLRTGKRTVAAADRDLAELAGLSHSTVAAALLRLQAAGFIRRVQEHHGTNAATWQLRTQPGQLSTSTDLGRTLPRTIAAPPAELFNARRLLLEETEQHLTDLRHDVFTFQGLGHHAGRLFALLQDGDTVELQTAAARLGISASHAGRVLSQMVGVRLLVKRGTQWGRTLRNVFHRAAELLGVDGVLERRGERFTMERIRWRWWLDHLTARDAPANARSPRPTVEQPTLVFFDAQEHNAGVLRYPHRPDQPDRPDHHMAAEHVYAGRLDHLYGQTAA